MASESRTVSIVPLNRSNYPTWKLQCKMAFIRDGAWSIVNGSERAPDEGSDAHYKHATCTDQALATIVLSIDPSLLYLVGDPNDPANIWKKLGN